MNPKEIGSLEAPVAVTKEADAPEQPAQEVKEANEGTVPDDTEDNESGFIAKSNTDVDETALMNQEFLLDPDLTVRDFLVQNSVEVVDFVRFECGEEITEGTANV